LRISNDPIDHSTERMNRKKAAFLFFIKVLTFNALLLSKSPKSRIDPTIEGLEQ
jgi:hypothetical protein